MLPDIAATWSPAARGLWHCLQRISSDDGDSSCTMATSVSLRSSGYAWRSVHFNCFRIAPLATVRIVIILVPDTSQTLFTTSRSRALTHFIWCEHSLGLEHVPHVPDDCARDDQSESGRSECEEESAFQNAFM
jgi:hypothetical protein